MTIEWTIEEFERAKKFWQEGNSAKDVAIEVGKTRNAVLSKLHRANAHHRDEPAYMRHKFKPQNAQRKHKQHKPIQRKETVRKEIAPPPIERPNPIRCVTIRYLKRNSCRYPLSDDPRTTPPSKFLYCGARQTHGAYCEVHAQLAYIPLRGGRSAEREAMHMMVQQIKPAHEEKLLDRDALA